MSEPIKIIFAQPPASELDRAIKEGIITYLLEQTDKEIMDMLNQKMDCNEQRHPENHFRTSQRRQAV